MNRVVAGVVGLAAAAAVLVGCSSDKGEPAPATAGGGAQVGTGGSTEVKVDGKNLSGLDLKSVTCVKQGGKISVASGAINGQAGLAVVLTDANPPTVVDLLLLSLKSLKTNFLVMASRPFTSLHPASLASALLRASAVNF